MKKPLSVVTACCMLCTVLITLAACTKEVTNTTTPNTALQNTSLSSDGSTLKTGVYRTFVIEAGNHFCNNNSYPPFRTKVLFFTAVFNNSAIYNFTDPKTKYDQNTLYGFADNLNRHQQFSARFGWRWFNNQLQIAAYANNNGDSTIVQIGSVPLNTEVKYGIVVNATTYDFYLNDLTKPIVSLPRSSSTRAAIPYKLFPYFGGDAVAPHRVTIKIRED